MKKRALRREYPHLFLTTSDILLLRQKKTAPQEFRHRYLTIWTHLLKAAKKRALPQAYPPPYSTTVCSTHTLPRRKAHLREYQLPCSMTELLIYMKSSL